MYFWLLCFLACSRVFAVAASLDDITAGPVLTFRGAANNQWQLSAMAISRTPSVVLTIQENTVHPNVLATYYDTTSSTTYYFLRYSLAVTIGASEQCTSYRVGQKEASFFVPPSDTVPSMFYYSCNDINAENTEKNWDQVWQRHNATHIHLGMGGGDQIYADKILDLPFVKSWLTNKPDVDFNQQPSKEEESMIDGFYFQTYMSYLSVPAYARVLASIPFLNMNDDHEFFDGWGSYPSKLQTSPILSRIFLTAQKHYLAFQQHTHSDLATSDGYLVGTSHEAKPSGELLQRQSFSFIREMGKAAVLGLDHRGERTRKQIMSQQSFQRILGSLESLNAQCQHLLVMVGVPIVFPDTSIVHGLLREADPYAKGNNPLTKLIAQKLASLAGTDVFGLPDITDDIMYDHWDCLEHKNERNQLLTQLMQFTHARRTQGMPLRLTILSGDIHLGALGRISFEAKDAKYNPYDIMCLTSSGIGSKWDSSLLLTILNKKASEVQKADEPGGRLKLEHLSWRDLDSNKPLKESRFCDCLRSIFGSSPEVFFEDQRNWLFLNFSNAKNRHIFDLRGQLLLESGESFVLHVDGPQPL